MYFIELFYCCGSMEDIVRTRYLCYCVSSGTRFSKGMIHALLALVSCLTGSDADDLHVRDILPAAQPTQNMGRNHN
jgi:hypothetical protein